MTKQEKKLTKALLKEVQRIIKHLLRSKSTMLPLSEIQINLVDEEGDGAALYVTAAIDEETGEIELERGFEDISRDMDIEVELEDGDCDFSDEELDDMWNTALKTNSSRRLLN